MPHYRIEYISPRIANYLHSGTRRFGKIPVYAFNVRCRIFTYRKIEDSLPVSQEAIRLKHK
jgi:hypothetical protein